MKKVCRLLGDVPKTECIEQVRNLIEDGEGKARKAKYQELTGELLALREELRKQKQESEDNRKYSKQALETLSRVREFITLPAETLNKSRLFDEKVLEGTGKLGDKVINVLVSFNSKMEQLLVQLRGVMGEVSLPPQPELKPEPVVTMEAIPSKPPRPEDKKTSPMSREKSRQSSEDVQIITPIKEVVTPDTGTAPASTPGSSTRGKAKLAEVNPATPQSKISKDSPTPSQAKMKTPKPQSARKPIRLESEDEEEEENEEEGSNSGTEKESEPYFDPDQELAAPRKKRAQSKAQASKAKKQKIASDSIRKQPARKATPKPSKTLGKRPKN